MRDDLNQSNSGREVGRESEPISPSPDVGPDLSPNPNVTCGPFHCRMTEYGCRTQQEAAARGMRLLLEGVRALNLGMELDRALRCQGCPRFECPSPSQSPDDLGEGIGIMSGSLDVTARVIADLRDAVEELERKYCDREKDPAEEEMKLEARRKRRREWMREYRRVKERDRGNDMY
jgi:hypothetical protein